MRRRIPGTQLTLRRESRDEPRELVDDFNSDIPEEEFAQMLVTARVEAPKAVEYLLRLIGRQGFAAG